MPAPVARSLIKRIRHAPCSLTNWNLTGVTAPSLAVRVPFTVPILVLNGPGGKGVPLVLGEGRILFHENGKLFQGSCLLKIFGGQAVSALDVPLPEELQLLVHYPHHAGGKVETQADRQDR